jgi:hypothetical protein
MSGRQYGQVEVIGQKHGLPVGIGGVIRDATQGVEVQPRRPWTCQQDYPVTFQTVVLATQRRVWRVTPRVRLARVKKNVNNSCINENVENRRILGLSLRTLPIRSTDDRKRSHRAFFLEKSKRNRRCCRGGPASCKALLPPCGDRILPKVTHPSRGRPSYRREHR